MIIMELAAWCRWGFLLALLSPGAAGTQGGSWLGEGSGRCGCAHGRPETRGPESSTARQSGAMGRFRLPAPRPGGGSEQLGMGQSLGGPHWRSGPAPSGHSGVSPAPGDSGNSSEKFPETGRKVFLRRVCEALCVRAPASPLPSPPHAFSELFQLAASASGPDWAGCLRGPLCPAPPPPHPAPALWV